MLATEARIFLTDADTDELVRIALETLIREEIRRLRSRDAPVDDDSRIEGPPRWTRYRLTIPGLGDRLRLSAGWKLIADCTANDLEEHATLQLDRAASLTANAKIATDLAAAMRVAGATTVNDFYTAQKQAA